MPAGERPRQRGRSRVEIDVERMGARSGIRRVAEEGSARARFPTERDGVPEAVLVNTGGGIAGGDLLSTRLRVAAGARLVATTVAAEKIYRSDGTTARILTEATIAAGAHLDWLPQETILFDGARLARSLDVACDRSGTVLLFEATVFGRAARGEEVQDGLFEDRWRVRRGARLVHADTLRLHGRIADRLAHPAVAAGMRAVATLLYVAPDAEARLDGAREGLAESRSECGASAWDGRLVVRWLAPEIGTLRRDAARFLRVFRGRDLPRVWNL